MKTLPTQLIMALCLICFLPGIALTSQETGRDRHFIAYDNGVVYDEKTNLEWIVGPDRPTDWNQAKSWVESLNSADDEWRMPTSAELHGLYRRNAGRWNRTSLLKTTGWWVWSGETSEINGLWSARAFFFKRGYATWLSPDSAYYNVGRGFAVRSRE